MDQTNLAEDFVMRYMRHLCRSSPRNEPESTRHDGLQEVLEEDVDLLAGFAREKPESAVR